jgi:hypothetical protein
VTVINFPGHHWARCTNKGCKGCFRCHGGPALCARCGGLEGTLPSDCPSERMLWPVGDQVYAGEIDFRHREGWVRLAKKGSDAS